MEENAKDECSAGENWNGDVLDGFHQSFRELGRLFWAAHWVHELFHPMTLVAWWLDFGCFSSRFSQRHVEESTQAIRHRTSHMPLQPERDWMKLRRVLPPPFPLTCQRAAEIALLHKVVSVSKEALGCVHFPTHHVPVDRFISPT